METVRTESPSVNPSHEYDPDRAVLLHWSELARKATAERGRPLTPEWWCEASEGAVRMWAGETALAPYVFDAALNLRGLDAEITAALQLIASRSNAAAIRALVFVAVVFAMYLDDEETDRTVECALAILRAFNAGDLDALSAIVDAESSNDEDASSFLLALAVDAQNDEPTDLHWYAWHIASAIDLPHEQRWAATVVYDWLHNCIDAHDPDRRAGDDYLDDVGRFLLTGDLSSAWVPSEWRAPAAD